MGRAVHGGDPLMSTFDDDFDPLAPTPAGTRGERHNSADTTTSHKAPCKEMRKEPDSRSDSSAGFRQE